MRTTTLHLSRFIAVICLITIAMQSQAADVTAPSLKVVTPTSKTVVTSNLFTAAGTASDNVGLALVYYQLNNGEWTAASSGNSFTNWTAPNLNLTPGQNVLRFYAKDLSGNVSPTNSVTFTFVVTVPVTVNINIPGSGTLKPNLNGTPQTVGKVLSMSAKAAKGYAFVNWTGATNTSSAKISFVVASNLVFNANFKDIGRPVNVILNPTKNQVLSNPVATGRASDNVGVTGVWYRLNTGDWVLANLTGGGNWQTADLSAQLFAGANAISAYALDAAGNISLTNTIAFSYTVQTDTDWAPDSLNGLLALVSPNNGSMVGVSFDPATFAQISASNSGDTNDYNGGTYTYVKTDTNTAQLSLAYSSQPGNSNNLGPISLVFTNHYAGYFSNSPSDTGAISLRTANAFVPATLAGKTITAVSGNNGKTTKIILTSATTFTKTPANNSSRGLSSGTYVYTRLSPMCATLNATFTSPADEGQTAWLQLTFATSKTGLYFVMVFDNTGALQDVDLGTFKM